MRVLTSDKDRTFAGNVAVNLNNQTVVKPSFLRSNHPEIIQLANTLSTKGYYLERREGELESLTPEEIAAIERTLHHPVKDRTISVQPACQSYIAFFHTNVDIAKKNPKQIFISGAAGGYFEKFIGGGLTAEKFIFAWELYRRATELKRKISRLSRTKDVDSPCTVYESEFSQFEKQVQSGLRIDELEAAAPQSAMFLIALLGKKYNGNSEELLLQHLEEIAAEIPKALFALVRRMAANRASSWPTLLKSQSFFDSAVAELKLRKKTLQ